MRFDEREMVFLRRCVELAQQAYEAGDEAFGSVLVDERGEVVAEDRNRIAGGDATRHPEFYLARWAAQNMTPEQRAGATVYTSGEHCPMCAAAHAWVGLGDIVYVHSSQQLASWLAQWGVEPSPVATLPINTVAPGISVRGPVPGLDEQVKSLHRQVFTSSKE